MSECNGGYYDLDFCFSVHETDKETEIESESETERDDCEIASVVHEWNLNANVVGAFL